MKELLNKIYKTSKKIYTKDDMGNLEGTGLYLRKNKIVYPILDITTNKIILKNLLMGGSVGNLVKVIFVILLIFMVSGSYSYETQQCRAIQENPVVMQCISASANLYYELNDQDYNTSGLDFSNFEIERAT